MGDTLFPAYEMGAFRAPEWFCRHGLLKYKPLVTMLRSSWRHWAQAEADGLTHLAPIIMIFAEPPAKIRQALGGHVWHQIRTASVHTNCNRMVLRLLGGWSMSEAMEWPGGHRHAKTLIGYGTKNTLLIACRHASSGKDLFDHFRRANDFVRMLGTIDPTWGRKRLKREHDARAIKLVLEKADPTPWARPWFCDVGGYSFSLLKSQSELAIEGACQRHCCGSYAQDCRKGTETVFSVIGQERATVSFNSKFRTMQVMAAYNRKVRPATLLAAQECVRRYFKQKRDRKGD